MSSLGNALNAQGKLNKAVVQYNKAIANKPDYVPAHYNLGNTHQGHGKDDLALESYKAALDLKPDFGEAYWSMANLKIFEFKDSEVDSMLNELKKESLSESEEIHFRFALGKAYEDKKDYSKAWHYYHTGNQKQRTTVDHFPVEMEMRYNPVSYTHLTLPTNREV